VLDNVLLQDIVGHAKRLALRIEVFLLQVVTIVTVQVAERATGFYKYLKFARSLDHCSNPNLQVKLRKVLAPKVPCPTGNAIHGATTKI
jgi:hypothetical protein